MPKFEIVTIEEAKKALAEGKLKTRVNGVFKRVTGQPKKVT